jgi:hypothetical protein
MLMIRQAIIGDELEALKVNALEKPLPVPDHEERVSRVRRVHLPSAWTADHVAIRLVDAFTILRKLPKPRGPKSPGNSWPEYAYTFADVVGWSDLPAGERAERDKDLNKVSDRPTSRDLAIMEAAFEWLRWLRTVDDAIARIIALTSHTKASDGSIRALCRAKGWHRATVDRKVDRGLQFIVDHLIETRADVF